MHENLMFFTERLYSAKCRLKIIKEIVAVTFSSDSAVDFKQESGAVIDV